MTTKFNIDLSKFCKCSVLVIGDLMLDEYVWGEVDRISPEAPVQVVQVKSESFTLGGAGNVVNNLGALGASVSIAGVIGDCRHGERIFSKFAELGVDTTGVVVESGRQTTRKTRIIAASQHVLRIDRETRKEISQQTVETLSELIETKIPKVDIILISDYGKGVVTNLLLKRLIASAKLHKRMMLADPKGLDFSKYSGVTVLTPNKKEAALASGIEIRDESSLFESAKIILQSADIETLLITCGKDGMALFERGKDPYLIKAEARQVYDVSGAGDTAISVLGLALASGASLKDAATLANTASGIVVGKIGTATVSKQELSAALKPYPDESMLKFKSLTEIPMIIQELRKQRKRIVMTNGCFDLLHAGHVMLFSASKKLGDVLIVAIDDDISVRTLKGAGRPVIKERERIRILSALDSVDFVIVFSSGELLNLIEMIQPDVLTKGSNYASDDVLGCEVVEQYGGRVELFPIVENISSTDIINSIKNSNRKEN